MKTMVRKFHQGFRDRQPGGMCRRRTEHVAVAANLRGQCGSSHGSAQAALTVAGKAVVEVRARLAVAIGEFARIV